jgi:hypothetical protein
VESQKDSRQAMFSYKSPSNKAKLSFSTKRGSRIQLWGIEVGEGGEWRPVTMGNRDQLRWGMGVKTLGNKGQLRWGIGVKTLGNRGQSPTENACKHSVYPIRRHPSCCQRLVV